ncbi:MAG: hypothetical protein PVI26_12810, partial [Chitinispirillia bacterium]
IKRRIGAMKKSYIFLVCIVILEYACSPKTTVITTTRTGSETSALSDECLMKEEVCLEARDFQKIYERMPEEEKKEMVSVLNTYIMHCEEAMKNCEESKKKKNTQ